MTKADLPRLTIKQIAADNHVASNSVHSWLSNHKLNRKPYCIFSGRALMVRLDVAERYAAGRAPGKPKGWVARKVLAADLGLNVNGRLLVRLLKGARTQTYRSQTYIHPDDAALARTRYLSLKAPPSYRPVAVVARELGRDTSVLHAWAKSNGVEMPFYLAFKVERHIHERDAARYAEVVRVQNARRRPLVFLEAA